MSIQNEEFCIDFQKFGLALYQDEVFRQINYPAEALGLALLLEMTKILDLDRVQKSMQLLHIRKYCEGRAHERSC